MTARHLPVVAWCSVSSAGGAVGRVRRGGAAVGRRARPTGRLASVPSSGSYLKLPPNSTEYGEKWLWRAAVEGALERVAPYASGVAIAFAWFVPK